MSDNQSDNAAEWGQARAAIAQQPDALAALRELLEAIESGDSLRGADAMGHAEDVLRGAAIAQPAEPLIRGLSGKCGRSVCECERDGLGNQCIWLEPTDAELGRRTGEPHVDGYPLFSGIPPGAQAESSGLPRAIQWGALYSAACGVTAKLGKDGSIQTDDAAVDSLMNALHALDGGQWMPGLMPGPGDWR